MKWPSSVTTYGIFTTVALWVVWDIIAYAIGESDGNSTESVTVGTWMDKSLWVTFAIFGLVTHLAASGDGKFGWKHALTAGGGASVGYILTRYS